MLWVVLAAGLTAHQGTKIDPSRFLTQPLVRDIYTADPSAHVFEGRIFIYPSHDIEAGVPADNLGSQFAMREDRKSTRLNSSHLSQSRMPSSA